MTDRTTRLYVLVVAVLVFVVTWAAVAAKPWVAAKPDPRLAALAQREQQLRTDAVLVRQILAARATISRSALAQRPTRRPAAAKRAFATASVPAPPVVRVVNLPPLTITKTS